MGLLLPLLLGCSEQRKAGPPVFSGKNVLLISIDTCRADYLEPYGGKKIKTPHINALAQDGFLFTDAVTPVPLTLPAHTTLLTGLHPIQHNVRDNFSGVLGDSVVTLPELFREAGYATAGVIGSILISHRTGLGQGFDVYKDEFTREEFRALQPSVERKGESALALTRDWLDSYLQTENKKPFFLFVHFYDPHKLYQPPAPFDEQYAHDLYGGEIAYVDFCIGKLVDGLKENGLYDDLLLVLIGDHGEGLGDHEEVTHGLFLYEEAVHVPFLVKLPNCENSFSPFPIHQTVSLEDVTPTLIELCGLGFTKTNGVSLAPWLLRQESETDRWICLETQYPLTYNWSPMYSLRSSQWKYIHTPRPELYNLLEDPKEKKNLAGLSAAQRTYMNGILENQLVELARTAVNDHDPQYSIDRAEILTSLGYMAAGNMKGRIGPDRTLPDAKDKISVYIKNDVALGYMMKGMYSQAIDMFLEVVENDPTNPTPYFNLGLTYMQMADYDNALSLMEKAVLLAPESIHIHLHIAKVLLQKGEYGKCRSVLESIIAEQPMLADAHFQLGWLEMMEKRFENALVHFQEARRWMPDMPNLEESIAKARQGES
jgi:arylsulfatase A-like enzyme